MKKFVIAAVLLVALAMVPGVMAGDTVQIDAEVQSSLSISVTEGADIDWTFANVGTQSTSVPKIEVSSNIDWDCTATGTNDGKMLSTTLTTPATLIQGIYIGDSSSVKTPLGTSYSVVSGAAPTGQYSKNVYFEQTTEYGDKPDKYGITITFAVSADVD
ncbi:hypothetical protein L1S32_08070 [Methanogenium sp. S4BF]|uniref:hypothetical protein n=1 Tax=Methanogenium sp. S4BF TaxID=1789226 RepID=UPI002418047C|nr:hypothetical protein [Methanogenium sp. S4BF]WFN33797.1 hypothetical protein L1S32_08070 [Methanogenium sp. S4BF]